MSAYLFSALYSQYDKGRFVEYCSTILLYGGDETRCQQAFQEMLTGSHSGEDPSSRKVEKLVVAPVLEQLLKETGSEPINWPEVAEAIVQAAESTPLDDQEQGYWVDCDQWIQPDSLAPDIDRLRRDLPEEIRSGLNWSADKSYVFLISVLAPPAPPRDPFDEPSPEEPADDGSATEAEEPAYLDIDRSPAALPSLVKKELAVVVRARNSVVGAWLWRKHAASTPFARHAVHLDAMCDLVCVGGNEGSG